MAKDPSNQEIVREFISDDKHLQPLLYSFELDSFFLYQDEQGYFKLQDDQEKTFDAYLMDYIEARISKNITPALIDNIKKLIKLKLHRRIGHLEPEYVSLSDQTLHISSFELYDHDVSKLSFTYLPFMSEELLDPKPAPLFRNFLDEVVIKDDGSPDRELQDLLQEMFGYCLLPTTKAEKTFFLVGEGANGKSVLLNLLRQVVGEANCSSYSIEAITTDKWATSGLIGKTVNICSEEESDYIKSDKFKAVVSGEPITLERKFGNPTTGRVNVKFIFATNEMPTFSGFNHGLLRRMVIIPLKKTIEEHKRDVDLTSKLLTELPGIVAWALIGAKRLIERNYRFILPEACKVKEEEFKENLSSALQFVKENYKRDPDSFLSGLEMYGEYKNWAKDRGVKQVKQKRFSHDIGKEYGESVFKWNKNEDKSERGWNLRLRGPIEMSDMSNVSEREYYPVPEM